MFRDRRKVVLVISVLVLFALLSMPFSFSRSVRGVVTGIMSPVFKFFQFVYHRAAMVFTVIFTSDNPYGRAERAQNEINRLEAELTLLKGRVELLKNLNEKLGEIESTDFTFIPSTIIGREPTRWYNTALLDKGSRNGVKMWQPVVSGKNFVGIITEVGAGWSRVRFIIDPRNSMAGQLEDSKDIAHVSGTSLNRLRIDYLDKEANVAPGTVVLTAKLNLDPKAPTRAIPPAGFIIGKITSVPAAKGEWHRSAWIKPAVNFDKLSAVLILNRE